MDKDFIIDNCVRGFCAKGCGRQDKQLNTYDYLAGIPGNSNPEDLVEVQFKHTRKGYYRNDNHLPLEKGDMVAVEASPGHDIGVVTLTGLLVPLQMKKANLKPSVEIKRVYRKARPADLEKYEESKALEQSTMIRSRQIAKELELNMKIGDVEYQGDGNKAIFYYIADARVDFRQLIKVLADAFHVRIEMKQIGARQEAGRIGGIGPCGRELCCATWMKNFNSVSTTAARFQDISPNPQKLAGQCAKLKCCLNYEVDTYVEASKKVPQRDIVLETADASYYLFKTDILAGLVTYSTDKRMAANLVTITVDRAQYIIQMNKAGEKPLSLDETSSAEPERPVDLVEQEDLHRFDKSKRRNKNANKRRSQSNESKRERENPVMEEQSTQDKVASNSNAKDQDLVQRDVPKERKPKDPSRQVASNKEVQASKETDKPAKDNRTRGERANSVAQNEQSALRQRKRRDGVSAKPKADDLGKDKIGKGSNKTSLENFSDMDQQSNFSDVKSNGKNSPQEKSGQSVKPKKENGNEVKNGKSSEKNQRSNSKSTQKTQRVSNENSSPVKRNEQNEFLEEGKKVRKDYGVAPSSENNRKGKPKEVTVNDVAQNVGHKSGVETDGVAAKSNLASVLESLKQEKGNPNKAGDHAE